MAQPERVSEMKTTILLLIILLILSGCLSDNILNQNQCTERIATIGLPGQMIEQGRTWLFSLSIGETIVIDKCYTITRETENKFTGELLC